MNINEALAHLHSEPRISSVINNSPVIHFTPSGNIYLDLLDAIVSQQLSVKAATTIYNRFCALFPDNIPHPELILALEPEQMRAVGVSGQKAGYLRNVAAFAVEKNLENIDWHTLSDEAIVKMLTQIKGVGVWTVQMLLIFSLNRPDIFPVDDLGIQQGMARLFGLKETGKELKLKMLELAEPWRPWRTVASRYLWKWKDNTPLL